MPRKNSFRDQVESDRRLCLKLGIKQVYQGSDSTRTAKRYEIAGPSFGSVDEARLALKRYNTKVQVLSALLVVFVVCTVVCLALLVAQDKQQDAVNANRGCIASAYQATNNGGGLRS